MKKAIMLEMMLSLLTITLKVVLYGTIHMFPIILAVNVTFELVTLPIKSVIKVFVKDYLCRKFEDDIIEVKLLAVYLLATK
ncbi:MAG: hypothetical protein J6I76_00200 [Oribacterium sp.]|nr:hypothetical protein [Oribacterium sp.]